MDDMAWMEWMHHEGFTQREILEGVLEKRIKESRLRLQQSLERYGEVSTSIGETLNDREEPSTAAIAALIQAQTKLNLDCILHSRNQIMAGIEMIRYNIEKGNKD